MTSRASSRLLVFVGLLIPVTFGCNTGGVTAAAPPSGASPAGHASSAFDADHAFTDLKKQVDFGPRVPNTDGHDRCRDWLVSELNTALGNAKRQDFDYQIPGGTLHMSNILAQVNPGAKKQIMLCAHWDTRPTADQEIDPKKQKQPIPGANDGASGVAVLLELARVFAANKPDVGVQIVLWDGEDYGPRISRMFLGAKHYAKDPALPRPDYAILIDMIGDKELTIPREPNSQNVAPEINDRVWKAAAALGITQFQDRVGSMPIEDDHIPLQEAGWKAIDLIDFDYGPWHTLDDTPAWCSAASLKAVGDVLASVVYGEK